MVCGGRSKSAKEGGKNLVSIGFGSVVDVLELLARRGERGLVVAVGVLGEEGNRAELGGPVVELFHHFGSDHSRQAAFGVWEVALVHGNDPLVSGEVDDRSARHEPVCLVAYQFPLPTCHSHQMSVLSPHTKHTVPLRSHPVPVEACQLHFFVETDEEGHASSGLGLYWGCELEEAVVVEDGIEDVGVGRRLDLDELGMEAEGGDWQLVVEGMGGVGVESDLCLLEDLLEWAFLGHSVRVEESTGWGQYQVF